MEPNDPKRYPMVLVREKLGVWGARQRVSENGYLGRGGDERPFTRSSKHATRACPLAVGLRALKPDEETRGVLAYVPAEALGRTVARSCDRYERDTVDVVGTLIGYTEIDGTRYARIQHGVTLEIVQTRTSNVMIEET
jgi:hypothetical protein